MIRIIQGDLGHINLIKLLQVATPLLKPAQLGRNFINKLRIVAALRISPLRCANAEAFCASIRDDILIFEVIPSMSVCGGRSRGTC